MVHEILRAAVALDVSEDTVIPGTGSQKLKQIMERTAEHEKTMTPDHIRKLIGEHLVQGEIRAKEYYSSINQKITDIKGKISKRRYKSKKRNTRKRNTRKRNTRKRNTRNRNTRKRNTRKRNTRKCKQ